MNIKATDMERIFGMSQNGIRLYEKSGILRLARREGSGYRDYGAEEMFLRSRGSLRVRMELADSDYQDFMNGGEDAVCQYQGVFMQQYSWAEPMVYTLQEKKELMLARMGKRGKNEGG